MRSQTSAMVDGVDITFSNVAGINSAAIQPTPDITQEFKLITNNYSAEYGRGNSVLNIVTKSGTNEYHGTVYWFLQNDNLNANDLFLNRAGQAKAESKRNQAGFAGGGPVVKNKIWFFRRLRANVSHAPAQCLYEGSPRSRRWRGISPTCTRLPEAPSTSTTLSTRLSIPGTVGRGGASLLTT